VLDNKPPPFSSEPPIELERLAREALQQGDCLRADEWMRLLSDRTPSQTYLFARIKAQMGDSEQARALCVELATAEISDDLELDRLALIARTYKDAWQAGDPSALARAAHEYEKAAERFPAAHFPAVNAATLWMLEGERERAHRLALRVLDLCRPLVERQGGANAWTHASYAEAAALLGREEVALRHYEIAAECMGRRRVRDQASMRRQARWIGEALFDDRHHFDSVFSLPIVLIYSGHMIDRPRRTHPRFPESMIGSVQRSIEATLDLFGPTLAYGSAACGSDILTAESLVRRRGAVGELHLMLSGPRDSFVETSVAIGDRADSWKARFQDLVNQGADTVSSASRHAPSPLSLSYAFANRYFIGMATMRAKSLALDLQGLVIWDGLAQGDGAGGTSDVVGLLREQEIPIERIGIGNEPTLPAELRSEPAVGPSVRDDHSQALRTFLFADTVRFSELSEAQLPQFWRVFLGRVSRWIAESEDAPMVVNTWGDALFMVFDDVGRAGRFALGLRDALDPDRVDWEAEGLPARLQLRFGLHCGPAFLVTDPVTRSVSYTGRHATYAARIEPKVAPGEVMVSEAFAALAALEAVQTLGFRCHYAGKIELEEGAEAETPVYRLEWLAKR